MCGVVGRRRGGRRRGEKKVIAKVFSFWKNPVGVPVTTSERVRSAQFLTKAREGFFT